MMTRQSHSILCSTVLRRLTAMLGTLVFSAMASAAAPHSPSSISKLLWRNVGPWIGGRVVAVDGVASNKDLFYMGAVDGGVWKSTDYGLKWENITDHTLPGSSDSIGAIAVSPSDPRMIYVGTGESDIRNDVITGDGMFRSDDAGKTWHAAGLADSHTISAIVVDPRNPDIVYASSMGHVFKPNAERGVFKSSDGGKTWRKILYIDDKTGAIDLVMSQRDPDTLYAATWQASRTAWGLDDGGPGSGLYKSVDGGEHWIEISRNPGFPKGMLGRIGVSVAANDPQVVYSIVQAEGGGVFRSNDGGASWTQVNDNWSLRQRGFYYMGIYVDPTNPNTVYAPEADALWVSRDGGRSFAMLRTPHGDNHVVWINPNDPKILLEGNDGGATVSTDGGKTWSTVRNQPTGQFYHVSLDGEFPVDLYGSQQDEGSIEGPSATSDGMIPPAAWHQVAYDEATFVAPQPDHPDVTFGSGYFSIFLSYNRATGQFRDVSPWPDYEDGASSGELKYRFGWTHPIFFSASDPKDLFVASQYVLKSSDDGRSWLRISPDLTRNDPATEQPSGGLIDHDQSGAEVFPDISSLAVSPLNEQVIWAGSADGLVHVTRDDGKHWATVTPQGLPEWAQISSIEPSRAAAGSAYLSASRYVWDDFHPYVFETTDYGQHWNAVTTGIPDDEYVLVVRQDPSDQKLLFAGTKSTVYVSLNGGKRWEPLSLNLPHVQVRDLAINVRQGEVAIATHGRSFWVLDDLSLLEQLSLAPPVKAGAAQVYVPETAWLSHAYGTSEMAKYTPDVGTNPPFGVTVYFHIPASYHGHVPVSLTFLDSSERVIRTFTLLLKKTPPKLTSAERDNRTPAQVRRAIEEEHTAITAGFNRFQWNLRYPDATDVTGFYTPAPAGGLLDSTQGPTVLPGAYSVVLDYDGHKSRSSFNVLLDPRLHSSPGALQARLALELRIHDSLDALDRSINQAIGMRSRLEAAISHHTLSAARAHAAIVALDEAIGSLVQLAIHSSQGDIVQETKLHSRLCYLAINIDLAYDAPTPAEYSVFTYLDRKAKAGELQLKTAAAKGARAL